MKNENEVLDSPVWIILINVVALEMLKAKMPRFPGQCLPRYHVLQTVLRIQYNFKGDLIFPVLLAKNFVRVCIEYVDNDF